VIHHETVACHLLDIRLLKASSYVYDWPERLLGTFTISVTPKDASRYAGS
jgi:hypothetical protein